MAAGKNRSTPQKAARKKLKKKKLTAALVIFLTFYLALMLLYTAIFLLVLTNKKTSDEALSLIVLYENGTKKTYDSDTVYIDGVLYIPYTELDKICSFIITGDSERITLISGSSEDYCTLYKDSQFMYIGNVPFRITAPVEFREDDYYIPVEILENYMIGVTVDYEAKKGSCTVSCQTPGDITFIGKYQVSPDKIDENTIPVS